MHANRGPRDNSPALQKCQISTLGKHHQRRSMKARFVCFWTTKKRIHPRVRSTIRRVFLAPPIYLLQVIWCNPPYALGVYLNRHPTQTHAHTHTGRLVVASRNANNFRWDNANKVELDFSMRGKRHGGDITSNKSNGVVAVHVEMSRSSRGRDPGMSHFGELSRRYPGRWPKMAAVDTGWVVAWLPRHEVYDLFRSSG